jgi:hypothetical protein
MYEDISYSSDVICKYVCLNCVTVMKELLEGNNDATQKGARNALNLMTQQTGSAAISLVSSR